MRLGQRPVVTLVMALIVQLPLAAAETPATNRIPLPDRPRYAFQHIGEDLGLSSRTVTSLLQDKQGFIWIGSYDGVQRFDGTRLVPYTRAQGLPSGYVEQLVLAPDGAVWAATDMGIARFDGSRFVTQRLPMASIQFSGVSQGLAFDSRGDIYLATVNGLLYMDVNGPAGFRLWERKKELPDEFVVAVHVAKNGYVWFAARNQVGVLKPGNDAPRMYTAAAGLPGDPVKAILTDGTGTLWVRTRNHLVRFEDASERFIQDDAGLPGANDFGMPYIDASGKILVPTVLGLFSKNGRWEALTDRQGLASNAVYAVLEDREGALWIGYGGAGLDRWPGRQHWSAWTRSEGLPNDVVWCTLRDSRKRLWVGTNDGLAMWDPGARSWHTWNENSGLAGRTVRHLVLGADGSIWALSIPGSLTRFDPTSLAPARLPLLSYGNTEITDLERGPDGAMWISGRDFLARARRGSLKFEKVALPAELAGTTASLAFAPGGILWGGGSKGLFRYDGKEWKHYSTDRGDEPGGAVAAMVAANAQEIWYAQQGEPGLVNLQLNESGPVTKIYARADGLPSDAVFMVAADGHGNVWAGGDNGVAMYQPDGTFRTFDRGDGLIWDDISPAGFRAESDGTLLIGTSRGLSAYHPNGETAASSIPGVVITTALLGTRDRVREPGVEVGHGDRTFNAQFAALTFRDAHDVRCRYRLDSLEHDFTETMMREVRYPELASGNYAFEVSCRTTGQAWGPPAVFAFTIQPAWWQRWWARLLEIALGLWALWGLIRWRTRTLEAERKRLEQAVEERNAELAAANRELQEASITDPLTGVRNRRFMQATIPADVSQTLRAYSLQGHSTDHRDLVLYLLDVDHFKEINDNYGHQAGDMVLSEIAMRLSRVVRLSDLCIRWGGEEFLIICRAAERDDSEILATRLLDVVAREPFDIGDSRAVSRTGSIGWAAFPWLVSAPHALTLEDVLTLVDRGLYSAKKGGRNQAVMVVPAHGLTADQIKPGAGAHLDIYDSEKVELKRIRGPRVSTALKAKV